MSLRNKLEDFSASTEGKDSPPESVTVSEDSDEGLEVNAMWLEERERSSLIAGEGGDTETDVLPSTYYNTVTDEELVAELEEVFDDIKSVVSVDEDWDVHSFSFSTITESEGEFENPFTPDWADYGAMALVTNERSEVSESGSEILSLVAEDVRDFDESVSVEDLNTVEVVFSDFEFCHLQSVHVYVETANPHRFYSDVETLDEYVSVVADSEEEVDELLEQDSYEVFVRLDDPSGDGSELPEELVDVVETEMVERITSAVDSEVEWFYESQSMVFNREDGVAEQTSFYLRVPFCSEK